MDPPRNPSKQDYLKRIGETFPDLAIMSVEENRDGVANDVVIVNREKVFRFGKQEWSGKLYPREARVVGLLSQYVDLQLPLREATYDDFVVTSYVPGDPLYRSDVLALDDAAQDALAIQLADFLRRMHGIPDDVLAAHDIPTSAANRDRNAWLGTLKEIEREIFPYLTSYQIGWVARLFQPVVDNRIDFDYLPVLVHGDLQASHILYDSEEQRINGIIDFGESGLGDPAADFADILYGFGEGYLNKMMRYYPDIEQSLDRARFQAGTIDLQLALLGLSTKETRWRFHHVTAARDIGSVR